MIKDELKNWKDNNGYSRAKLTKALKVAVMTVSRWETGIRTIPTFLASCPKMQEIKRR